MLNLYIYLLFYFRFAVSFL